MPSHKYKRGEIVILKKSVTANVKRKSYKVIDIKPGTENWPTYIVVNHNGKQSELAWYRVETYADKQERLLKEIRDLNRRKDVCQEEIGRLTLQSREAEKLFPPI